MTTTAKPAGSVLDLPGVRERIARDVAAAPPATPEQIELVNRAFRAPHSPAGGAPTPASGRRSDSRPGGASPVAARPGSLSTA